MNRWQASLTYFIPVLAFIGMCDMLRGILAPELEKKLKIKLTDWEWQYYLREGFRRAEVESKQEIVRQRLQRSDDMKIIHDFIWGEERGKSW